MQKRQLFAHGKKPGRTTRTRRWTPETLEDRIVLDAVPVVALNIDAQSMIGESVDFSVTFDNQPSGPPTTGFGPYIDLFMDVTGTDGVSPGGVEPNDYDGFEGGLSASFLGASLPVVAVTIGAGGSFTHPIATDATGLPRTGTAPTGFAQGDVLYVVELPFGSYVGDQTPAEISFSTMLSAEADLGIPLNVATQGGFRYGSDALNNPTTDNPIVGLVDAATTTPTVIRLFKEYIGPESETATGPNFPRQYRIRADIADGQTINNLRLIDILPDDLAFLSVISTSATTTNEQTPTVGVPDSTPNNDLVELFSTVTGTGSDDDANVVFEFFVPDVDATNGNILDPISGNDDPSTNDARATGDWNPTDPNDSTVAINIVDDSPSDNFELTNKSIAIQKSSTIISGGPDLTPGDVVEYTLSFQISDYFTFGDLVVADTISDGQRLTGSPAGPFTDPFTLSVTDRTDSPPLTGTFTPSATSGATNLYIDSTQIGNDPNPATDGSTRLVFDVSRAMVDLGASDGILQGGRAIAPDAGGAVGTITYRTVIQQQFSDEYPSGEPTVDEGDLLGNSVTITGTVRSNTAIGTVLGTESDDSAEALEIATGQLVKTTYAVNGVLGPVDPTIDPASGLVIGPSYANSLEVRPGDVVTYRLRYILPTGDVEDFTITDFLPLPVYDASIISTTLGPAIDSSAPAPDSTKYGPDHTFSRLPTTTDPPTLSPAVSVNAGANSVEFNFGTFDNPPPESPTVIDLLIATTISDAPMADRLPLTNMATTTHGTTNAGSQVVSAITQTTLTQPLLNIRKGIVSTNNANASFTGPVAPAGVSFEAPGLSTPVSFSGGTINSTNLGSTLDADLNDVDAGDLVKFAIVVENEGTSSAGAFDIQVRDSLPAGFSIPAGAPGLNLEVFDGAGAAIPFTTNGTGLFDPAGGIEFTDPGPTPATGLPAVDGGALDEFDAGDGQNIAIVTFDLQVDNDVVADTDLLNTATLYNYAGQEGGDDHTAVTDVTDTAQVTIAEPDPSKTIVQTSINNASNTDSEVVIGEIVTYELQVDIPEGTLPGTVITDTLDGGLAFVDVVSVSTGSLLVANTIGTGTTPANTTITNNGQTIAFDIGDIDNNDRDNSTPETISIQYRAVVLNVAANQSTPTTNLNNSAVVTWTGGAVPPANAPTVRVIEPSLDVAKVASTVSADVADTVTYTITLSHDAASTDAFDLTLSDIVPTGLNYVAGTWVNTGGLAPDSISDVGALSATWASFPDTATSTFQFDTTISSGALAGSSITNSATADWTSLSGPTTTDISTYNTNSRERTGAGLINDYNNTGSVDVDINVPAGKSLVSTSETSTSGSEVTIGEIVRYQIAVQIPESLAPSFAIVDNLPSGMQFLDDGTAMVALVSDGGLTSSTLSPTVLEIGSAAITPTAPLPATAISGGPFVSGSAPTFSLGDLTNADDDANGEFAVVEFNAIVTNILGNVAGVDQSNNASIFVDGSQVGPNTADITVNVVEPSITNLTKTPSTATIDAGESITYTLAYSASNAADTASAFNVQTFETLPTELTGLTNVRVRRNGSDIVTGFTNSSTPTSLSVSIDVVAPGDTIEVVYDATVATTIAAGAAINNNAAINYTSLPGGTGTVTNPTGSSTGPAGGTTGERTGDGGVNSYAGAAPSLVTVNAHEISGYVYHDANNNGVFDEPPANGIGGTSIRLLGTDHLGNPVDLTETTLADGSYSFATLRAGSYSVTQTQPGGFLNGLDTLGSPSVSATNTDRTDDALGTFLFSVGTTSTVSNDNNFGELLPATITGTVYVDANNDGQFNSETPIPFVPITLTGTDDQGNAVSLNTTTNGGGSYAFTGLRPGAYNITETTQPVSFLDGLDTFDNVSPIVGSAGGPDTLSGIVVTSGQSDGDNNFGEVPFGTIRGRVFTDANNDGSINGSDQGIGGVTIELAGTDVFGNNVTQQTTTASDGTYQFTGLMEGTYTVTEPTQPNRYFDGIDSLAGATIPGSGATDQITGIVLPAGGDVANNDFGEVPDVGPTGYVYADANTSGTRQPTEAGIEGVEITLTGTGLDVFGNPIPVRTAFTGPDGFYQFLNVPPGNYTITETQPAGIQDGDEENGTPPAATVTDDQFSNIDLTDIPSFAGEYNFGEILPTASLAGSVYVDANNNGLRDAGELGLAGVTVTLFDSSNTPYQVVTDSDGNYQFVKMFPGEYRLVQSQPTNFIDGQETAGSAGGVISNDRIDSITITADENETGYLFGELGINPALISKRAFLTTSNPGADFTGPAGSGVMAVSAPLADPAGYVYIDANANGLRDDQELGIPGVVIRVAGLTIDGDSVEYSTRTDASGFYQFAFLSPGVYAVYEQQPIGFADGAESLGSLGGNIGEDSFTDIVLREGDFGFDYNFGELPIRSMVVGDSNRDGVFDAKDLLLARQTNEYEDDTEDNSTFAEGDWNGDGDFDAADLLAAFQQGHYSANALDLIFDDFAE